MIVKKTFRFSLFTDGLAGSLKGMSFLIGAVLLNIVLLRFFTIKVWNRYEFINFFLWNDVSNAFQHTARKQTDRSKERHVSESRNWLAFRLSERLQKSRFQNGIFSGH
ncbi:MAG: hypothetical protein Q4F29_07380 [Lachnospiraceae bacterium]|nr:hypothetical protein [Lachnospiraceae bacterium]